MDRLNEEVAFNDEIHEALISLKIRESNLAYSVKFNGNIESLPKCYYILRYIQRDQEGSNDPTTQKIVEMGQAIRGRIINFLFDTVDHFGENREIAFVAIDYLDRYLLTRFRHDNENILPINSTLGTYGPKVLDLYVLASLGLAIKLFSPCSGCPKRGERRKSIDSQPLCHHSSNMHYLFLQSTKMNTVVYNGHGYSTFVALTGGDQFIVEGICKAESNILATLQWYVHPPTSYRYIQAVFQFVPPGQDSLWESLRNLAFFQAELALSTKGTNRYPPSVIALCAVSNSIHRHLFCQEHMNEGRELNQHLMMKDMLSTIIRQIEGSLQISYEFDERIITLKGLLTKQIMKFWRESMDIIEMKENSKKNRKSSSPEGSQFTFLKWEQCFFLENLESFFPVNAHKKRETTNNRSVDVKNKNAPLYSNDLENHYNKYIRPKLYNFNGTMPSRQI